MNDSKDILILDSIETRWERLRLVRNDLANELESMAKTFPPTGRKPLRSLVRWFRGEARLADALLRSDVMAVALPLLNLPSDVPLSKDQIAHGVRAGFSNLSQNRSYQHRIGWTLLYPLSIMVVAGALAFLGSHTILPLFVEMFTEFGIELPKSTRIVLAVGRLIRHIPWPVIGLPIVLVALLIFFNGYGANRRPAGMSWLDMRLMNARTAIAAWAWHIALLLETGISQPDAVTAAGQATGQSWLRRKSLKWATSEGQPPPDSLFKPRFSLVNQAMQLPPSTGKIALLREVADNYWDRSWNVMGWFMKLAATAMIFLAGLMVFFVFYSFFRPLLSMATGVY